MTTMVSFQIIPGSPDEEAAIRLLREQGLFDADGPNRVKVACEAQPLIPPQLVFHPLITLLMRYKLFAPEAPENNVFLPISRKAAKLLKISSFTITPLASYTQFVCRRLDEMQASPEFAAASKGAAPALGQLREQLLAFQGQLGQALKKGEIFVADPRK
jgi:hypothetical protein